jgi:oligopeptide transport system substrate-binding protein
MLVLVFLCLSSCGFRGGMVKDTLRMNLGSEPTSLDWELTTDSNSFDVVVNLMTGLTKYSDKLECVPGCAENWEVLDGGKHYVFHLRKDAYWTDGKPVLAGDFEYAWKRLLNPQTGSPYAFFLYDIENALEYATGKTKDPSKLGIKAVDDHTLDVRLKKPAAYFLYLTAYCPTAPQRKDIVEKWGNRWTEPDHIVTNGPFKLDRWAHEYKIELVSNEHYFQGPPKLKRIKMFMVPEAATAFLLYETNELDYVDNRSFSTPDVDRYRHSPEYKNIALLRNNYICFNTTKKPFDDVRVRQAVSLAIDRAVFPRILRRNELPTSCWIPPALLGYDKNSGFEFNPVKARELLALAGFPNGKDFPKQELLYPNREDTRVIVEAIQDQLSKNLGIRIDLVNQESKVYFQTVRQDPPPIFKGNWGADYPDPETFMNVFTSENGNNHALWKDAHYDRLVSDASAEQVVKKRGELYRQADAYLCKEQCPVVPLFLATQNLMVKPWVKGIKFNSIDVQFLDKVYIDSDWSKHLAASDHVSSASTPDDVSSASATGNVSSTSASGDVSSESPLQKRGQVR